MYRHRAAEEEEERAAKRIKLAEPDQDELRRLSADKQAVVEQVLRYMDKTDVTDPELLSQLLLGRPLNVKCNFCGDRHKWTDKWVGQCDTCQPLFKLAASPGAGRYRMVLLLTHPEKDETVRAVLRKMLEPYKAKELIIETGHTATTAYGMIEAQDKTKSADGRIDKWSRCFYHHGKELTLPDGRKLITKRMGNTPIQGYCWEVASLQS